jgi:hypothetical protein
LSVLLLLTLLLLLRLSWALWVCLQAKQDLEQVKEMAGAAVNKLSNMAGRLLTDLGRY